MFIKRILIILIILTFLSSCQKKIEKYEPEYMDNNNVMDANNQYDDEETKKIIMQIETIVKNKDKWLITDEYLYKKIGYAITDLDNNNKLEIITSKIIGDLNFVINDMYEFDDEEELIKINWLINENNSNIDIIKNKIPVYISNDNKYYYLFITENDFDQDQFIKMKSTISLDNYTMNLRNIAMCLATNINVNNENTLPEIIATYTDEYGNLIDEESYDIMEASIYGGKDYELAECNIKWISYDNQDLFNNLTLFTDKEISIFLADSYQNFNIIFD